MAEPTRKGECYLTIAPGRRGKADVVKMTKGIPFDVRGDSVVVKVAIEIPERAFRPPFFDATVEVPEDYVGRIIVRAADPAPPSSNGAPAGDTKEVEA